MSNNNINSQNKVKKYFNSIESRLGYAYLLKGRKHFGYYLKGHENISIIKAQKNMEDILSKKLSLKNNSLVLDAGCGEGKVAIYLAKNYQLKVTGIDLLNWAIKNAKKNAQKEKIEEKVNFEVMDYTNLSFPDKTFDAVYTMETFVHSPDYKKGLKEFYRVIKPGGRLVMFEYSISSIKKMNNEQKKIANILIEGGAMPSMEFFIHDSFPQILKSAGFRNIQVENATQRIMPFLKQFYKWGHRPYKIIKFFNLQKYFINATSGVEGYINLHDKKLDLWRYNIISATR